MQPRRRDWATIEWGGRQITSSSNIVFSNGLMDPWHGTGVLESLSDTLVAVIIPEVGSWGSWGLGFMGGWVGGMHGVLCLGPLVGPLTNAAEGESMYHP